MVTKLKMGYSKIPSTFGKEAFIKINEGMKLLTLYSGDTDSGIVENLRIKLSQLGSYLNKNTVVVITLNSDFYKENELISYTDMIIDLSEVRANPSWALTILEKLIKKIDNSKEMCYIILDCSTEGSYLTDYFKNTLMLLENNIFKEYEDKIVLNIISRNSNDLDRINTSDIIEVVEDFPLDFFTQDLLKYTNEGVVNYLDTNDLGDKCSVIIHNKNAILIDYEEQDRLSSQ